MPETQEVIPAANVVFNHDSVPRATDLAEAMSMAMSRARDLEDPDPDPYGYLQELEEQFPGIDLLTPQWRARPSDPRWVKRVRGRARKAAVAAKFLMGDGVPAIAAALRVSEMTIYNDLKALQAEWRKSHMADIEALAGQDLARLDYLMQKLAPAIDRGEVKAISAALDIVKERASILGYRQGVQVDIEEFIRAAASSAGFDPNEAVTIARRVQVNFRG